MQCAPGIRTDLATASLIKMSYQINCTADTTFFFSVAQTVKHCNSFTIFVIINNKNNWMLNTFYVYNLDLNLYVKKIWLSMFVSVEKMYLLEHLHKSSSFLTLILIHELAIIIYLSINMDTHSHIQIVHAFTNPFKPLCGFLLWYDHGHMTTTMAWECEHSFGLSSFRMNGCNTMTHFSL